MFPPVSTAPQLFNIARDDHDRGLSDTRAFRQRKRESAEGRDRHRNSRITQYNYLMRRRAWEYWREEGGDGTVGQIQTLSRATHTHLQLVCAFVWRRSACQACSDKLKYRKACGACICVALIKHSPCAGRSCGRTAAERWGGEGAVAAATAASHKKKLYKMPGIPVRATNRTS